MTKIDQFESVFKSASRTLYRYEDLAIAKVLLFTDLEDEYQVKLFGDRVRSYLRVIDNDDTIEWRDVKSGECDTIGELLDLVEKERPDLICTYRHLHSTAWKWPYSLGSFLDVLTQATDVPILVLPRPEKDDVYEKLEGTNTVMAITDHLTGDDRLVNYAVRFTQTNGTLILSHVEDQAVFQRYIATTEKIREIDTDIARKTILAQLLKEPSNYINSCREILRTTKSQLTIQESITLGYFLEEYKQNIQELNVDLLVLNTKDDDQLAMHGLAYPLAVELRSLPLLML